MYWTNKILYIFGLKIIKKYEKNSLIGLVYLVPIIQTTYCQSESSFSAFTNRTFYKPFVSEISSTLNNISLGSTLTKLPNGNKREMVLKVIHLGVNLPILYGEQPKYKWAMSFPVSIHMIWAPFEETTSPIINNDYRFGLSFTGITYLKNHYVKNLSFKVTPFAHESTHLGDEITIYGIENLPDFYRVNVS